MGTPDTLYRYLFENYHVRGELVQLSETIATITRQKAYPESVKVLLAELVAATSLLTATLKFEGDITVQLQNSGPLTFIAVNGNHNQQLRGAARWDGSIDESLRPNELLAQGQLVITITPHQGERYQGIVAIDTQGIAASLERYFEQSEQLATRIWLYTGQHQNDICSGGAMLQLLPASEGGNMDDLNHLSELTNTLSRDELFSLPGEEVLYRLYHQEEVRLFDPMQISFACSCSRQRCESALFSINKEELLEICEDQGQVTMDCDHCGSHYEFDRTAIEHIFNGQPSHNRSDMH
jgi:molecular chaperone Hsp33